MREIKFRAWDNETRKMANVGFTLIWENCREAFGTSLIAKFDERIEFMQYTGLKDKNGKEIYEGDILGNDPADDKWVGVVKWEQDECRYSIDYGHGSWNELNNHRARGEVIGNIYENQELLTPNNN